MKGKAQHSPIFFIGTFHNECPEQRPQGSQNLQSIILINADFKILYIDDIQ